MGRIGTARTLQDTPSIRGLDTTGENRADRHG